MGNRRNAKNLAYYIGLPYTFEVTPDTSGTGYVVSVKERPGCLSQGDTIAKAMDRVREAMELWFSVCIQDGLAIPEPGDNDKFSGRFVLRLPKTIHRAVAQAAERDGTSLNMYIATKLAQAVGAGR